MKSRRLSRYGCEEIAECEGLEGQLGQRKQYGAGYCESDTSDLQRFEVRNAPYKAVVINKKCSSKCPRPIAVRAQTKAIKLR